MIVCDCIGKCKCGAVEERGVVRDGNAVRASLMMMDSAGSGRPAERKPLAMMTDSEKQNMRDSVRGMPIYKAVALPIYDDVRGAVMSGMPAERYCALVDGADGSRSVAPTEENVQRLGDVFGARQIYERGLVDAWKGNPGNDNNPGSR